MGVIRLLAIPAIGCSLLLSQTREAHPVSRSAAEAEVLAAVDKFYEAFLGNDVVTVERLTAEDYLQTDVNGKVQDKRAWLDEYYKPLVARMKSTNGKWEVFDRRVTNVRIHGHVAVLLGTIRLKPSWDAAEPARTLRYTQVWSKVDGQWKRMVLQNSWSE